MPTSPRSIVADGVGGATPPIDTPGLPAFAGRLASDGIDAVLAHVKSHWPDGPRAYQAGFGSDGSGALAAPVRGPVRSFPVGHGP